MKRKGVIKAIALVSVVAAIGIGGTLAYLNSITQTATNVFASNKNIFLELREPAWDGYQFAELNSREEQPIGDEAKNDSPTLGINQAASYLPGADIDKNPMVKNTGTVENGGIPIYAAIELKYYSGIKGSGTEMTYAQFKEAFLKDTGIIFDSNWTDISEGKNSLFMYNKVLGLNESTADYPVFSKIPLSSKLIASENGALPKFYIEVTAFAVQAESLGDTPVDIAKAELKNLAAKN